MIILPAIDLLDGRCVRLYKGEYETAHKVAENPEEQAKKFVSEGAEWLHVVDLNGAKDGCAVNGAVIESIVKAAGIPVEVGGGIRNMDTVDYYIGIGVSRIILGSAALASPDFVKEAVQKYGEKIAVGIDCRDGYVSVSGWTRSSNVNYIEFAKLMESVGVKYIIFTDISRDGMLSGPNTEMLGELSNAVSCNIIASGGIRDIENIRALTEMNLYGAICGKSLYSDTLSLTEAISVAAGGK